MPSCGLSKYIETKLQGTCAYLILGFFKKIIRGLELVFLSNFQHKFCRKIFFLLYSINSPSIIVWFSLLREILDNTCIVIVC